MPTIIAAFTDGWGRVLRAPAILLGSFAITLLIALPAARAVGSGIAGSLGSSLDAERMAEGVNGEWWERFEESARGLDTTFTPSIIGFGAVVDNLSRFVDNSALPAPVVGVVAASLAVWLFLIGGILDRYARRRPLRAAAFFGACGTYFVRFLRLAVIAAAPVMVLYALLERHLVSAITAGAVKG